MPISGVVIRCRTGRADELALAADGMEGVSIYRIVNDSTLVAVIEAPTVDGEVGLTQGLMAMDGVVDVQLAYHSFEDIAV